MQYNLEIFALFLHFEMFLKLCKLGQASESIMQKVKVEEYEVSYINSFAMGC